LRFPPLRGFWKDDERKLVDFFVGPCEKTADLYRPNARSIDVSPEGLTCLFDVPDGELSLSVSLLLTEGSLFFEFKDARGFADCAAFGLLLPPAGSSLNGWVRRSVENFTYWQNDSGMAIISAAPFRVESVGEDRLCVCAEGPAAPWYVVFEANPNAAERKALDLARSDAISFHRARIAEFFDGAAFSSGDRALDDAVSWALFSAWTLSSGNKTSRIGASGTNRVLGGDGFGAFTGAYLASGRFDEARAFLVSYADALATGTADGSLEERLLFVRATWAYAQYTGDIGVYDNVSIEVFRIVADASERTDSFGFLLHGDGDTWMDSRTGDGRSFAPRGDRAIEIQALWHSALLVVSSIARLRGDTARSEEWGRRAEVVKTSFLRFFWSPERSSLADRLTAGPGNSVIPDFRVRPNQLLAHVASACFADRDRLIPGELLSAVSQNAVRELVSPFGLFSLCPDDPLFHPDREKEGYFDFAASCHNGMVWPWLSGPFLSACAADARDPSLSAIASDLFRNEAAIMLGVGCCGSLPEQVSGQNPSERDSPRGSPREEFPSRVEEPFEGAAVVGREAFRVFPRAYGAWSHALANAEFARNAFADIVGFRPRLAEYCVDLLPRLPDGIERIAAACPFGLGWKLRVELTRSRFPRGVRAVATWENGPPSAGLVPPRLNGIPLVPGQSLELFFPCQGDDSSPSRGGAVTGCRTRRFPERDLSPAWCGSILHESFLSRLLPLGLTDEKVLGWFYDSDSFRRNYPTEGKLGAEYSSSATVFRLWAPTARAVSLVLFPDGDSSEATVSIPMQRGFSFGQNPSVWELAMSGDLHGAYYRFRVRAFGVVREIADPYARACGVNGARSMVVDFSRTNPPDWNRVVPPSVDSANDVIAYEAHVADLTSSPTWNGDSRVARTYLGAAQRGTKFRGFTTGIDYVLSLGVTHVQLMPVFDFSSVDENRLHDVEYASRLRGGVFNWGYDPQNHSVPEGSYSTDPRNGVVRVRELKTLIREFLANGVGVIMDVVYNHVPSSREHPLSVAAPGYYFRAASYSGAGDDTASEREMFRRYMIDSLSFWLSEYKLSGFRFDLMGLHDVETMNAVADSLRRIKSDVVLYGEGWDMYRGDKMVGASMLESRKLPDYGFFNDAFRCAIKGSAFDSSAKGFVHDGSHLESLKFGLVGATFHQQVHNRLVDGTANPNPWSDRTSASVNYADIHDNLALYDKLVLVEPDRDEARYERLQKTALSLVLLAQGMPVLHAGCEFMRTKEILPAELAECPDLGDLSRTPDGSRAFSHNSYNLGDRVNGLDWNRSAEKHDLVEYVRRLVAVRKAHSLFRLRSARETVLSISFFGDANDASLRSAVGEGLGGTFAQADSLSGEGGASAAPGVFGWVVDGCATVDSWLSACVAVNVAEDPRPFALPPCANGGAWHLVTDGTAFFPDGDHVPAAPSVDLAPKALYLYAEF